MVGKSGSAGSPKAQVVAKRGQTAQECGEKGKFGVNNRVLPYVGLGGGMHLDLSALLVTSTITKFL